MSDPKKEQFTKLRISSRTNERLKRALENAHQGMSISALGNAILEEALSQIEATPDPGGTLPHVTLLRNQRASSGGQPQPGAPPIPSLEEIVAAVTRKVLDELHDPPFPAGRGEQRGEARAAKRGHRLGAA